MARLLCLYPRRDMTTRGMRSREGRVNYELIKESVPAAFGHAITPLEAGPAGTPGLAVTCAHTSLPMTVLTAPWDAQDCVAQLYSPGHFKADT